METKTKLMLKGLSHETGTPFIVEIHSLDEVKKTGNYVVIGKNISTANGLPHLNDNTPQCFCCEGNLMVTCCYSDEEAQGNTTYGQTLIISDKESGLTNTYTRTINPAKNDGKWSSWKMMVNGDISVVAPANELYERVAQMADSLAGEVARATESEEQLNDSVQNLATEKADKDDYCPKLTTGFADNLVGRGEAVEAQFTFRPTGGTQSIEDGVARIERIKGNTIVWNQLAQPRETTATNGLTIESVGDGSYKLYTATDTPTTADVFFPVTDKLMGGHKVVFYYSVAVTSQTAAYTACALKASITNSQSNHTGAIMTASSDGETIGIFVAAGTTINTAFTIRPLVFDITRMFAVAADRPTTVDEFRTLFPVRDYDYNAGELMSLTAEGIKSVGFNLLNCDRTPYDLPDYSVSGPRHSYNFTSSQYLNGITANGYANKSFVYTDLKLTTNSVYGKDAGKGDSINFGIGFPIKVTPSTRYYFKCNLYDGMIHICHYDAQGRLLTWWEDATAAGAEFRTTVRAGWMVIVFKSKTSGGYVNAQNICMNIVHTGYRNGDYEPYEETTRQLPTKEYFPSGMKSASSTFDELTATQAITRVGVIEDLSKLDWVYFNSTFVTNGKLSGAPNETNQIISVLNYSTTYGGDKSYTIVDGGKLYIKDSAYTDVSSLKKALAGVKLCYALATPVVTDLLEPLNLDYKVSDFGTEAAVTDVVSAPMKMDVVYGFNAVDSIRNNRTTIESLLARVAELESKML